MFDNNDAPVPFDDIWSFDQHHHLHSSDPAYGFDRFNPDTVFKNDSPLSALTRDYESPANSYGSSYGTTPSAITPESYSKSDLVVPAPGIDLATHYHPHLARPMQRIETAFGGSAQQELLNEKTLAQLLQEWTHVTPNPSVDNNEEPSEVEVPTVPVHTPVSVAAAVPVQHLHVVNKAEEVHPSRVSNAVNYVPAYPTSHPWPSPREDPSQWHTVSRKPSIQVIEQEILPLRSSHLCETGSIADSIAAARYAVCPVGPPPRPQSNDHSYRIHIPAAHPRRGDKNGRNVYEVEQPSIGKDFHRRATDTGIGPYKKRKPLTVNVSATHSYMPSRATPTSSLPSGSVSSTRSSFSAMTVTPSDVVYTPYGPFSSNLHVNNPYGHGYGYGHSPTVRSAPPFSSSFAAYPVHSISTTIENPLSAPFSASETVKQDMVKRTDSSRVQDRDQVQGQGQPSLFEKQGENLSSDFRLSTVFCPPPTPSTGSHSPRSPFVHSGTIIPSSTLGDSTLSPQLDTASSSIQTDTDVHGTIPPLLLTRQAIDLFFAHPNVDPAMARLIQGLEEEQKRVVVRRLNKAQGFKIKPNKYVRK